MYKVPLANTLEKFLSHLAGLKEIDLIILRGHLLLEESLFSIISEFVFHPAFIKKSDISFSQMVSIAKSMSLDDENNSIWGLIIAINKLRNKIAHELLASQNVVVHINKVKDLYNGEIKEAEDVYRWNDDDCMGISCAVAMAMGFLHNFLEEVKRFKEAVHLIDTIYNPHRHNS